MTEQVQEAPPKGFDVNFVREFMTQRQGKWTVSYAGLLHLAHERGLVGIETNVLQFPTADNGMTCVIRADVRLERDGQVYTFADIGDANATNVTKLVAQHIIRMASTRAKARALRDAVNIGVTALEELAESEEGEATRPQAPRPPAQSAQPTPTAHSPNGHATVASAIAQPSGDGYIDLDVDGHSWRVPRDFAELNSGQLNAYRAWVRRSESAKTVGELKKVWETVVQPATTSFPDFVGSQIGRVFKRRREQLEKGALNGESKSAA